MNIIEADKDEFMNACQEVLKVGKVPNYHSVPESKDKNRLPQTDSYGRAIDNGP